MVTNVDGPSWEKKNCGFFPRREYLTLRAPVAVKKGEQVQVFPAVHLDVESFYKE